MAEIEEANRREMAPARLDGVRGCKGAVLQSFEDHMRKILDKQLHMRHRNVSAHIQVFLPLPHRVHSREFYIVPRPRF